MMVAVRSTGTQEMVSWLGREVGILERYFEEAMICAELASFFNVILGLRMKYWWGKGWEIYTW